MLREYRGRIPFLLKEYSKSIIYLCSSNRNIDDYYNVLSDFYDGKVLRMENASTGEENDKLNYDFLQLIKNNKKYIILISLDAFLKDYFLEGKKYSFSLGKFFDLKNFEIELEKNNFKKKYMLEGRREYSLRGDIFDIFPIDSDYPIRIEFGFENEIERITYFDLETQKSIEKLKSINMYIDSNKDTKVSFFDIVKELKNTKLFLENPDLLQYKLEELVLRDREKEEILRARYNSIKNLGEPVEIVKFSHEEIMNFESNQYIREIAKSGEEKIVIYSEEEKRYKEIFKDCNIEFKKYPLYEGYRDGKQLILTDRELKGIRVKRESKEKISLRYRNVAEIREGDYIIHENYGVGLYLGIEIIDGHDYLKIKYADEDKLFVPIEGIGRIEKYISTPGVVPEIYNLGRKGFRRRKEKLEEEMLAFAKEIVEIQARRETRAGYAFSHDTVWQDEFEESFPYKETTSQLKAIEDVKRDMESHRVMDRVICGDVGYGKTEIAIRAAFKAATDGKQVVLMVPTTVLAQQHYERFSERMKNYPITIELLSRLKSGSEQKKSLERIEAGSIDIVIGTHRLLSADVKFKDLGLVIIDEEQKFGVKAKEHLKKMKNRVDMLTLTATPIPRTLNLSLLGIRDLSVIDTPPEGRKPVDTFFIEPEVKKIKEVIMREIAREGQVFYIFNSVKGIRKKSEDLAKILPEYIKIDFVHGQMQPKEIKEKIKSFENGDVDILIATTIIENGIDIENANTMIIDGADKLGLSQIYQLRGRIGRGSRQGYCYLLTKEYQTKKAKEREDSIKALEDIGGGGLQLSLEDMRIRGAGEILGEKQHGALEALGYNLYMKMLQDEISKIKGDVELEDSIDDIELKVNYPAFIPDDYMEKSQKIKLYRRIAEAKKIENIDELRSEIIDRFGKLPQEGIGLFEYIKTKFRAREIGIKSAVEIKGKDECNIKFHRDKLEFEVLLNMIQAKKIVYSQREDLVEFNGDIKSFLDIYDEYRGEKNERI